MLIGLHGQLCILFFFLPLVSSISNCTLVDKDSLMSFSQSLSPTSLMKSWTLNGSNCCRWEGISCDNEGRVTHIWLPERGLTGHISPSLANLTYLSYLNLSHNKLFGSLPPGLLSLDNLEIIDLSFNIFSGRLSSISQLYSSPKRLALRSFDISSNLFTGEFPSFITGQQLTNVNASNNSFSGPIPSSICVESSFIRFLDFSLNDFSGEIPIGLGGCSKLEIFKVDFNYLNGSLPNDLYDILTLQHLSLIANSISGVIDANRILKLGNLSLIHLSFNELRGELPWEIGKLRNLEELLVDTNNMSGSLPPSLMNCTKLKSLNLRANFFSGDISAINFSSLSQLQKLDLGKNNFTGTIPISLYSCKSLTWLRLAKNRLQGQILPDICSLKSLSFLSLAYNKLTNISGTFRILTACNNLTVAMLSQNFDGEAVPSDDDVDPNGFQNLRLLSLEECWLTGRIPTWLIKLRKLEVLNLSLNKLTGSIPGWLGILPNIFYLDLSTNFLSGEIPIEITSSSTLMKPTINWADKSYLEFPIFVKSTGSDFQYNRLNFMPPAIYLKNNSLNGSIPPEIGRLQLLQVLDLSHNGFTGKIPDQLSNLTNLEKLDLSSNHLSDEIPISLKRLHFLNLFNVSENNLCGSIPSGGQFDTFSNSSYEGNPCLVGVQPWTHRPGEEIHRQNTTKGPDREHVIFVGVSFGLGFGVAFLLTVVAFSKFGFFNVGKKGRKRVVLRSSLSGLPSPRRP